MKLSFDLFTRLKEFVYREEGSSRGMVHSSLLQMCSPHPLLLYFLPNLRLKSKCSLYKGCIYGPIIGTTKTTTLKNICTTYIRVESHNTAINYHFLQQTNFHHALL